MPPDSFQRRQRAASCQRERPKGGKPMVTAAANGISTNPNPEKSTRDLEHHSLLDPATADLRNNVYRDLLARLNLFEDDKARLKARGLSDEAIERGLYRSASHGVQEASSWLTHEYGIQTLIQVPGFRPHKGIYWDHNV